jgi:tRNA pseudouridine38-40 synthase
VRAFKLTVGYDGTHFHGWQRQPGRRTVQGVIEEALSAALERAITVQGAGRTDAGCHARGQVASFAAETTLPARALTPILNRRLPTDVRIREAGDVPEGFDARRSAIGRRYAYRLLDREDVLWGRTAWHPGRAASFDALARAARPLEGEHDCSAFQSSGSTPTRPVCRIVRASWRRWEAGVMLDIVADHFLYHMVRNVVGTLLVAARDADPAAVVAGVLASGDRRLAGATAPPQGLCLEEVFYTGRRP